MRHNVKGRKLNRTASHRKAMFSNMSAQLFEHKQIKTTLAKAKELRKYAEKMITLGKKGDLNSLRQALKFLRHKEVVYRLFNDIAPNYKERCGGYTRVFKLGTRKGDAAEVAVIQLVEFDNDTEKKPKKIAKVEETKVEETKVEETKVEETKVEEAKVEEAKVEEAKVEEAKVEEAKVEEAKVEKAKVEEAKVEEAKVEEAKVEEAKVEEAKEEEKSDSIEEPEKKEK